MLKTCILCTLIILTFSLKTTLYKYKAMTELKEKVDEDVCKFIDPVEEVIYLKPCNQGYHCDVKEEEEPEIISKCVKNIILKKLGQNCNSDDECIAGHCKGNKCVFSEGDSPIEVDIEGINKCGNDLIYSEDNNSCINSKSFDYMPDYCKYTKKGTSTEINIQPVKPFIRCGESGKADEDEHSELERGTEFIKANKIGELEVGKQSEHEYTCKTGFRSVYNNNLFCDDVIEIIRKGINEEGHAFAEYNFSFAGHYNITDELYDGGFFYTNYFTGELEPYDDVYIKAFQDYVAVLEKNKKKCVEKSHDYYFNPMHCGIREIYDAYFYLNHMCLYGNKTKEAKMVENYFKMQEFTQYEENNSSTSILLKRFILGLIVLLTLF